MCSSRRVNVATMTTLTFRVFVIRFRIHTTHHNITTITITIIIIIITITIFNTIIIIIIIIIVTQHSKRIETLFD
jgi:hypothetical protein